MTSEVTLREICETLSSMPECRTERKGAGKIFEETSKKLPKSCEKH